MFKKKLKQTIILSSIFFTSVCLAKENIDYKLNPEANQIKNEKINLKSKEKIYLENDALWCTGETKVAVTNNKAAELIKIGNYQEAIDYIEKNLSNAPLFFPFRYNLGIAYMFLEKFDKALLNFEKARYIVPEYSKTYIQIGYIYFLKNKYSMAIDYYRMALKRNKKDLYVLVLIGNLYFSRNQLEVAKKYYDESLKINHRYANGLLGRAKIHFKKGEYVKALILLKSINTEQDYDKEYHYFFAECSYKLRVYSEAAKHYEILLKFRNDKFFIKYSPALIKHKLDLSKKFIP